MSRARAAADPELGQLVATARSRFNHVAPRKARSIVDLIRGLSVARALQQLEQLHRPSANPMISNLLKSAISNAASLKDREGWAGDVNTLVIGEIYVDSGPMLKRFMAAPMGRAVPVRKRLSHATIKLYEAA